MSNLYSFQCHCRAGKKWDPDEHARTKAAEEETRRDEWFKDEGMRSQPY